MKDKVVVSSPSAYIAGHARARQYDEEAADRYVRHLTVGDAALDPVMEELSDLPPADLHGFVRTCIEQQEDRVRRAPEVLRDFFDSIDQVPSWVDFEAFKPGQRAFHRNMSNMLIAYAVGSAVEGFSTLVAKSFAITGRVTGMGDGAMRRLRQNNRHMVEIYFPGGLARDGDGWKISTRIRFIHARIRRLLAQSDAWDHGAWGTPLSGAHVGAIALYTFSIRQFEHALSMGSKISKEERASIVSIWRYGGHLLGVPDSILFRNESEARRMYRDRPHVRPPDDDSRAVANTVFNVIPEMAGIEGEAKKKKMKRYAYRLSRALIGNKLADEYGYPDTIRMASLVLLYYRFRQRLEKMLRKNRLVKEEAFGQLFEAAQYDREGVSYRMPDHVLASRSSPW